MHARKGRRYAREEAGFAIKYSAPRQKQVAAALGIDQSNVSRQIHGEQDGDASRFYELVRRVVLENHAAAGHLIAGAMAVAEEAALELGADVCRARLLDALAQETIAQSKEDVASYELAVALGDDSPTLRAALERHDAAIRHETGRHVDVLIYNRALRVSRGWRAKP